MIRKIFKITVILFVSLNLTCTTEDDDTTENLVKMLILKEAAEDAAQSANGTSDYDNIKTWYSTMQTLEVQVVYETDAEPKAGSFTNPVTKETKNVWDITDLNLQEMFKNRSVSVTTSIPTELSSMTDIGDQGKSTWTSDDIISLGKEYRTEASTETVGRFLVAFVNGYYSTDGSSQETRVLGVSVSGTPYTVIFKDVVDSASYSNYPGKEEALKIYLEQSTVVHEMGHALGLVNNGVSMVNSHQDTDHGKHCTNTECLMYYANAGASDLIGYVETYVNSGSVVMFQSNCLEDTQSYSP